MTLKEMLNQAMSEMGFSEFNDYFGNTQQEARQLTAIANRELNQFKKDDWNELRKTHTITMTAATQYPLPSDYRQFTPDTAWSDIRRVDFPLSAEEWIYYEASTIDTGIRHRMRLADGQIEISNPSSGAEILIQYISDSPVLSALAVAKNKFTADDDTLILNNDLLILGVIWRFMRVKGLDWQTEFQEYDSMYRRERGTNGGAQTINTTRGDYEPPEPFANLWV
jgi:hypothetical protein